jgi:hypothetical protein
VAKSREQKRAAKAKKRVETRKKSPRRVRVGARAAAGAAPQASGNDPLSAEKLAELGYDPNIEVDVAAWKGLEERERLSRVAKYHNATLKKAHMPPSMQRHAAMHVIVESQIADAAPAEAKSALERLRGEGMSRHNAVHAIGWLATEHMRRAMAKQRPVDDKAYAKDLTTLTGHNWLKMAGLKSS